MRTTGRAMAILMGLTAGMGAMVPGAERVPLPVTRPVPRQSKRSLLRSMVGRVITWGYLKHPPSTNARERRAATKAKNRAKHRAHMKGRS